MEDYITGTVQPLLDEMTLYLIREKPADPVPALIQFLEAKRGQRTNSADIQPLLVAIRNQQSIMSDFDDDDANLMSPHSTGLMSPSHSPSNIQQYLQRGARISVSAAPTDEILRKYGNGSGDVSPKTMEERVALAQLLKTTILGKDKSDSQINSLIDGFIKEVIMGPDVHVVVDSKSVAVIEQGQFEKSSTDLDIVGPGDVIGNIAAILPGDSEPVELISISATGVLWRVNREYLDYVTRSSAIQQREKYLKFVSEVPILASMDIEELAKICDALKQEKFAAGETIVTQSETGNKFFIIESGECVATKSYVPGQVPREVLRYKPGDYFGELSLLHNEARQASVKAVTDVKLISIDRKSFKRLLGPIEDILLRNSQEYERVNESASPSHSLL